MGQARFVQSVSVFALCLASAASARAAHPNVAIEVARDAETTSCMTEKQLAASVERRLGRRVFDATRPSELELRVVWTRAGRWTANVFLADELGPLGTREISTEARHCSAMDDSLALVVALLVDTPPARPEPAAAAPVSEAPARAPVHRRPTSTPVPTPIEVPEETLAPREPFTFDTRAAAVVTSAILPGVAPGIEVAFGAKPPRGPWIRVVGELYFVEERDLGGGEGVRFSAQRIGLELCSLDTELGPLRAELCAGQRTGRIGVTGVGFDENRSSGRLTHGVVLGGHLALPLGAISLLLGLGAEIPFTRDQYRVRSDGIRAREVHQAPPVGVTGELGLRYEL